MQSSNITENITDNENYLKNVLGQGSELNYRQLVVPTLGNCPALIVFAYGMVDIKRIDEYILAPLMSNSELSQKDIQLKSAGKTTLLMQSRIFLASTKETSLWTEICDAIVTGNTVLLLDKSNSGLIFATKGWKARDVSEPLTESEVKGPREGFVEDILTNIVLIRRRVKDYNLRFDNFIIGERTKTEVVVAYLKDMVDQSILSEVKLRLNRIKVDSILESGYIEELIKDAPVSIFPTNESTERPDKASAAILEGRIVILVDNTPFALIVPTVFWNFIKASGDYYENLHIAILLRLIRLLALFLSTSASSFYVLLTSYHQEMIPTSLALKIAAGRYGVPFPSIIEAFAMEVILEVMREAGLRMPKPIGQTISIVGTLVIGQAAVTAGFVSPAVVIVIAVAAISAFAIPSYSLSRTTTLIRFPLLFATAFLGIFGYLGGVMIFCLYLLSIRSMGQPYVAPVSPFDKSRIKDIVTRAPWWRMQEHTKLGYQKDSQAVKDLKPKPPSPK